MKNGDFERLVQIMSELREKCPWDKKQTIQSLRQMTIEETYELGDAILENKMEAIKEELGDLLLHIVFYSQIATEQSTFTIYDVIDGICNKLIRRHPHIYAEEMEDGLIKDIKNEDDVKKNWEQLKLKEGKTSVLGGVPQSLPAVIKAMRLQEKAKQVGFEWKEVSQVWEKVNEETAELRQAVADGDAEKIEEEFGDLLFSLINYSRFLRVDAEAALERTNKKFINRFKKIEEHATAKNISLKDMTLEEMDAVWCRAKESKLD